MYLLEKEWIAPVSAGIEFFAAAICIILLVGCQFGYHRKEKLKTYMIFLLTTHIGILVLDASVWIMEYQGEYEVLTQIICIITYVMSCVVFMLFSFGLVSYISATDPVASWVNRAVAIYCVGVAVLWIIGAVSGLHYNKEGLFGTDLIYLGSQIAAMFLLFMDIVLVLRHRKRVERRDCIIMIVYAIFPLVGLALQVVWTVVPLYIGCTISAVIYYMMVYVGLSGRIKEQANVLLQKENMLLQEKEELSRSREKVLISQIQPHFIFNSLITIKYLCRHNLEEAERAIDHFAGYIRGSMDALTIEKSIPFERELEFVEDYLYIEKKRFGEKIKVQYDIREKDFLIPPLSIQTLVENAVRHGICRKLDGGWIKVSTWQEEDFYYVKIEDNGVGMESDIEELDDSHIGLRNTKERLKLMCNGELQVESAKGEGVTVLIKIPKHANIV